MTDKRILITGSRDWTDRALIRQHFFGLSVLYDHITIVHGKCPTGADDMADEAAGIFDMTIERYPADWQTYGKRAGFLRNAHMVSLGADFCLAYIKNNSKGATMCADLAEKAGIMTRRYRA